MPIGTVLRSTGSHYTVRTADGALHDCVARGQLRIQGFKSTNPIAVGDRVDFELGTGEKSATITHVHDRRNYLVRRSVNLSHQKSVIAANLEQALLMVTLARPRTSTGFIDRFLVTAEAYEVPCVLLFNKLDAYDAEELEQLEALEATYHGAGYWTLRTSAVTGLGVGRAEGPVAREDEPF
jgi:ribosome biogenesis GTPase